MSQDRPKIFVAGGCEPCREIKELAAAGRIPDADIVDVATDNGFHYIKELGIQGVPIGYKDGAFCTIDIVDREDGPVVELNCPNPEPKEK